MNKRGEGEDGAGIAGTGIMSWIASLFYIVIPLAILFGIAAHNYQTGFIHMNPDAEREIYVERVLNCFSKQDLEISRHYPVIDIEQVTKENLGVCFTGNLARGIKVTIEDVGSKQELATAFVYSEELPKHRTTLPVVIETGQGEKQALLHVDVT